MSEEINPKNMKLGEIVNEAILQTIRRMNIERDLCNFDGDFRDYPLPEALPFLKKYLKENLNKYKKIYNSLIEELNDREKRYKEDR